MRKSRPLYLILSGAVMAVLLTLTTLPHPTDVYAQDGGENAPAAETLTPQPTVPTDVPTETPTATEVPPTDVPPTATDVPPTSTPVATEAPATVEPTATPAPPAPVSIPEPITVVLFGTGLAALSAAAARRKNNAPKGDE